MGPAGYRDVEAGSPAGLVTLVTALERGRGRHGLALRLARRFATLGELAACPPAVMVELCGRSRAAAGALGPQGLEAAHGLALAALALAERHGLRVVTALDQAFPARLRGLAGSPAVLYVKGELGAGPRAVACVGTRRPTRFGVVAARRIATFLAGQGWSIVSGLALGVDSVAHRAAIAAGGHTVAVLGHGLDREVYPGENRALARRILEAGGGLVSEQPPGTAVAADRLVQRDRLQAALSAGVVLLQSDLGGGALHAVRFALLQGRPVFAPVPGGAWESEPESRALLAVTTLSGPALASALGATGRLARRLLAEPGPAASALRSRADYPGLLSALERAAGLTPGRGS